MFIGVVVHCAGDGIYHARMRYRIEKTGKVLLLEVQFNIGGDLFELMLNLCNDGLNSTVKFLEGPKLLK